MDRDQLEELTFHLAAGTSLPVAMAAIGEDRTAGPASRSVAYSIGLLLGVLGALAYAILGA
jgi:hypothetical protein